MSFTDPRFKASKDRVVALLDMAEREEIRTSIHIQMDGKLCVVTIKLEEDDDIEMLFKRLAVEKLCPGVIAKQIKTLKEATATDPAVVTVTD